MKNLVQPLMILSLLLSGCAHVSPNYTSAADNVENMRMLAAGATNKISVGAFTSSEPGKNSIVCRAEGTVEAPQGKPFESFLREALVGELKLAGLYEEDAPTKLQGKLTNIDFNSNIGAGKWTIQMSFFGDGISPFNVESAYSFSTNFIADIACEQVSQALPMATKTFIRDVTLNPEFRKFFSGVESAARTAHRPTTMSSGDSGSPAQKVQAKAAKPQFGKFSYTVEKMAKADGCQSTNGAYLTTDAGPIEGYRIDCEGGTVFVAHCGYGVCSQQK